MKSYGLPEIEQSVVVEDSRSVGLFNGLRLTSHFQPVFSLAHGRAVGQEALLRATGPGGHAVSPLDAFRLAVSLDQVIPLDRLSRVVHLRNFVVQKPASSWLFLNISPLAITQGRARYGPFMQELLQSCGVSPNSVVVEILESAVENESMLTEAIQFFRDHGFLIAIDDFGAGHSNFDRVWRLKPNIVKLDRALLWQARNDRSARSMIPRITAMIHESGALALLEGVENEHDAMIAMDADVDFVQGYFFAPPAPAIVTAPTGGASFHALFDVFRRFAMLERRDYQGEVAPYSNALNAAAGMLRTGAPFPAAVAGFLDLELAERCYLLDRHGRQAGKSVLAARAQTQADPRYNPLVNADGANWGRRHYFRRAIGRPDTVHVTRPYLSIATAALCVTVSVAYTFEGQLLVLCGDMLWNEKLSAGERTIDTVLPPTA
jgi:EAL domain-containing protein (putative c-di-GMP-specific phosphodiesterase class I)